MDEQPLNAGILDLATHKVCGEACRHASRWALTPPFHHCRRCRLLFSVTLLCRFRQLAVNKYGALCCPDFPHVRAGRLTAVLPDGRRASARRLFLRLWWLYVSFDDAAFAVADKHYDFVAFGGGRQLGLDACHGVRDVQSGEVQVAVYVLDFAYGVAGEVAAAQSDAVDAGIGYRFAGGLDVGRHVLVDECAALYHDVRAKVAELVYQSAAADDGVVVDDDFAGELCGVGDDDVVAYAAVVGDVRVGHDQAVVAHDGAPFGGGATVDGDVFAQGGVVAYYGVGFFATEFEVLGYRADDCAGEDGAVASDACAFEDGDVGAYACAFADLDVLVDGDEWVDDDAGVYLCRRVYVC